MSGRSKIVQITDCVVFLSDKYKNVIWMAPGPDLWKQPSNVNSINERFKKTEIQKKCCSTHRQFQDYTETHVFYHKMSNAAAKVSGLTSGGPEEIVAIIHNYSNKTHKIWNSTFCCSTPPWIPGLHWNPCFFRTRRLTLPRRCLDSLEGFQKYRGNNTQLH